MFCAFLAAERLAKEGTRSKNKKGRNKAPQGVKQQNQSIVEPLRPDLQNTSPKCPPRASQGASPKLPGTSWTARDKKRPERPGTGPGAAKSAPRAAQKRFRSGLGGHLAPTCRLRVPRDLQETILTSRELEFGPSEGPFSRSPALHLEPSGEPNSEVSLQRGPPRKTTPPHGGPITEPTAPVSVTSETNREVKDSSAREARA